MTKVLITGSQGFIGSYLCNEFLNQGYEVIGVDKNKSITQMLEGFEDYYQKEVMTK